MTVASSLRRRGIEMLDSPVSGADIGATNGNLTLFVGGSYDAFQRSLPVLQMIGRTVTYLGKNGNGQLGKIINEMMQTFSQLAIYEGLQLAEKMGLDLKMFARAASAGCAQSWRLDELVNAVFNLGEKRFRLNLRPERTGRAIELAKYGGNRPSRRRSNPSSVRGTPLGSGHRFRLSENHRTKQTLVGHPP